MNIGKLFTDTCEDVAEGMCEACGKNPKAEPHTCPFKEEINGDDKSLCTCCESCTENCAWDI